VRPAVLDGAGNQWIDGQRTNRSRLVYGTDRRCDLICFATVNEAIAPRLSQLQVAMHLERGRVAVGGRHLRTTERHGNLVDHELCDVIVPTVRCDGEFGVFHSGTSRHLKHQTCLCGVSRAADLLELDEMFAQFDVGEFRWCNGAQPQLAVSQRGFAVRVRRTCSQPLRGV